MLPLRRPQAALCQHQSQAHQLQLRRMMRVTTGLPCLLMS